MVGCAVAFHLAACGPPERLTWVDSLPTLPPMVEEPRGSLVVETPQGIGMGDDAEKRHPFYLYGADGRLIDRFPNEYALPIGVKPGKYIVIGDGFARYRQVQVEVKADMTTVVKAADFLRGIRID